MKKKKIVNLENCMILKIYCLLLVRFKKVLKNANRAHACLSDELMKSSRHH
jgi:hypothetical protein